MFEQMKGLEPKKKVEYYIQYYGWRTLGIITIIAITIFLIVHFATKKDLATGILAVNARGENKKFESSQDFDDFLVRNGYDPKKESVIVDCSAYVLPNYDDSVNRTNLQHVRDLFVTHMIDVFLADEEFFLAMAQSDYLIDLRQCIPEDVLDSHKDDLVYETNMITNEEILAGIRVYPEQSWMQKTGWYDEPTIVGLSAVMKNQDLAVRLFLEVIEED